MPLVRIEKGDGAGRTFVIESEGIIGRDPKVHIPITDDKASRHHAKLVQDGDQFFLEDLGSKNGTLLNGQRVNGRSLIESGDHIRIGLTWIHFGIEGAEDRLEGILRDYKIEGTVQTGLLGQLYIASQLSLDRTVMLKILPPNLVKANPEMKELFLQQLVGMASLNHENIVTLLDFGADESLLYFTTEHIEGVPLAEYLAPDQPTEEIETALLIGLSIARALAHAHARNVVHGSLSPSNITIGARRVALGNFGMNKIFSDGTRAETAAEGLLTEADYIAPEQVSSPTCDHRTDIYALGILLYRMLTGKVPFREATLYETINRRLGDPPKPVDRIRPEIPPQLAAIVKRCLEKDPDDRYQSSQALADDLRKVHAHYKVLALQGRGHRLLFGLKNEFFYLLDWAIFRWVFFPFLALIALVVVRLIWFGKM